MDRTGHDFFHPFSSLVTSHHYLTVSWQLRRCSRACQTGPESDGQARQEATRATMAEPARMTGVSGKDPRKRTACIIRLAVIWASVIWAERHQKELLHPVRLIIQLSTWRPSGVGLHGGRFTALLHRFFFSRVKGWKAKQLEVTAAIFRQGPSMSPGVCARGW